MRQKESGSISANNSIKTAGPLAVDPAAKETEIIEADNNKHKNNKGEFYKMEAIIILGFTMFAVLPFAAEGIRIYFSK